MAIKPTCDKCGKELTAFGALLFSPPGIEKMAKNETKKFHICVGCYSSMTSGWPNNLIMTLIIVHKGDKVLLAMKKRGFGKGRWNGFGGKVFENETIEQAARRETKEEGGIELKEVIELGIITFEFEGQAQKLETHIFKAKDFNGEPVETEEMKPQWFDISKIPFGDMWKDDPFWFPLFLADKKFKGYFLFDETHNIVKRQLGEER
jgi:8-oxo-dGTP diphosphatase/2-hydroxy-dATP diphosphatase